MAVRSILSLFSDAAKRAKEHIAIEQLGRTLSYSELDIRSSQCAERLSQCGIGSGSVVAFLVVDRLELIVMLLAALKSNCTFAALSPEDPIRRNEFLIEQIQPAAVVTDESYRRASDYRLTSWTECKSIDISSKGLQLYLSGTTGPLPTGIPYDAADLAYILFTSGSTGKPKPIAGSLNGLSQFIAWETRTFDVGSRCRVAQLHSPNFDPFLRDVFVPLCSGGTVCVPPDGIGRDAKTLIQWLDSSGISLLHIVPSLFRAILDEELRSGQFAHLKHVVCAGERLLPADIRKWCTIFGDRAMVVNLYGPTETTQAKLWYAIRESSQNLNSIPIGKPIEGASAIVMDDQQLRCPIGVSGELYIRTPFRSLGYYGRPDLTKERFLKNAASNQSGDYLYRTGDLARYRADGNIEFIGRTDNQVKIRGFRVELGEIEAALGEHPDIKEAVAVARESNTGDLQLVACVVGKGHDQEPDTEQLRSYLKQRLPEYMVPGRYLRLEALPLTPNGKVDRRALSALSEAASGVNRQYVAPRNDIERLTAGIWEEVLGIPRVGANDSFFELGGHSLLATQVLSRLRRVFNVEITLRHLFEAPTVAELAQLVRTQGDTPRPTPAIPLSRYRTAR